MTKLTINNFKPVAKISKWLYMYSNSTNPYMLAANNVSVYSNPALQK